MDFLPRYFRGAPPTPFDQSSYELLIRQLLGSLNLSPNPDDPGHKYDYFTSLLNGFGPNPNTGNHWPSEYKLPGHPRTFLNGFDTRTGQYAGPEAWQPRDSWGRLLNFEVE